MANSPCRPLLEGKHIARFHERIRLPTIRLPGLDVEEEEEAGATFTVEPIADKNSA